MCRSQAGQDNWSGSGRSERCSQAGLPPTLLLKNLDWSSHEGVSGLGKPRNNGGEEVDESSVAAIVEDESDFTENGSYVVITDPRKFYKFVILDHRSTVTH